MTRASTGGSRARGVMRGKGGRPAAVRIERAGVTDLMELATDTPAAPQHVAAVLQLDRAVDPAAVRAALAVRVPSVPRLRQSLQWAPLGGGRPVWVDDANFDMSRHLAVRNAPAPGDRAALLDVAAAAAVATLPRDRPMWLATVVTGMADGRTAVILVLHHVLADGIGGLAVLANLVDGAAAAGVTPFPVASPTPAALRRDAARLRIKTLSSLSGAVGRLRSAAAELRVGSVRRPPVRTSLNRPIGPRRRLAVVAVPLVAVVEVAHRCDATVNDVLLTAVGGALGAVLRQRGEPIEALVVSVPVSGRHAGDGAMGNQVGVMPVEVPTKGPPFDRLAVVAVHTRAARRDAPRGASATVLAQAFRFLARLGLFSWFVNRQRLVTTFVTNVRGPVTRMRFADAQVTEVVPISSIAGNVTVAFAALSYAGTLSVTVIADPDRWPDLPRLVIALEEDLQLLAVGRAAPDVGGEGRMGA